jgi:hypothetical protein
MRRAITVCFILVLFVSGCTRDTSPGVPCQSCSAYTASFARDIIPIFSANCSLPACHTGTASNADHLSLDSAVAYTQVTAAGSYILTGNANASLLYSQLFAGANNHMPNNGRQLSDCDIQKIGCWINQGAVNN